MGAGAARVGEGNFSLGSVISAVNQFNLGSFSSANFRFTFSFLFFFFEGGCD